MVKKLAVIREIFKGDYNAVAAARKLTRNQISALSGMLNYDKQAHPIPQLLEGQPVYVRSQGKGQPKWMPEECHERLTDRSYTVRCEGSIYRRNRVDL